MQKAQKPIVPAIQWHEGMLLAPQHFQQWDMRQHQLMSCHINLLNPFHYGILSVEIDQVLLPTGVIRLTKCDAILPDGTLVQYDITKHPILELDITSHQTFLEMEDWTIYLGMLTTTSDEAQTSGPGARFVSMEDEGVGDMNVLDNVIRIPRLWPRLHLILAQQEPARYQAFPLFKVGFQDEAFFLRPYLAPCFAIPSDHPLDARCQRLARRVREKVIYISEKWQGQVGSALLHETTQLLRPLVQVLPVLEGILQTRVYHPFQLYTLLCWVAGQIATLRLDQPPPPINPYDHNDILGSCESILGYIEVVFDSVEREVVVVPFENDSRFFFLHMSTTYVKTDALLIGVRNRQEMTESELEDWMNNAVIASDSCLEAVKTKRIAGAARRLLRGDELMEMLPGRGSLIFRVEKDPHFIVPEEKLNIFNMGDEPQKRPTDIMLYVRTDKTAVNEVEED